MKRHQNSSRFNASLNQKIPSLNCNCLNETTAKRTKDEIGISFRFSWFILSQKGGDLLQASIFACLRFSFLACTYTAYHPLTEFHPLVFFHFTLLHSNVWVADCKIQIGLNGKNNGLKMLSRTTEERKKFVKKDLLNCRPNFYEKNFLDLLKMVVTLGQQCACFFTRRFWNGNERRLPIHSHTASASVLLLIYETKISQQVVVVVREMPCHFSICTYLSAVQHVSLWNLCVTSWLSGWRDGGKGSQANIWNWV